MSLWVIQPWSNVRSPVLYQTLCLLLAGWKITILNTSQIILVFSSSFDNFGTHKLLLNLIEVCQNFLDFLFLEFQLLLKHTLQIQHTRSMSLWVIRPWSNVRSPVLYQTLYLLLAGWKITVLNTSQIISVFYFFFSFLMGHTSSYFYFEEFIVILNSSLYQSLTVCPTGWI